MDCNHVVPKKASHSDPQRSDASERLGRLAYAVQLASLLLYVLGLWLEVYIDTRKAQDVGDTVFHESHRRWRLRTSFLFLIWSILSGLALPFGFGWPLLVITYGWYALRVLTGCVYWSRGRVIGAGRFSRRVFLEPGK